MVASINTSSEGLATLIIQVLADSEACARKITRNENYAGCTSTFLELIPHATRIRKIADHRTIPTKCGPSALRTGPFCGIEMLDRDGFLKGLKAVNCYRTHERKLVINRNARGLPEDEESSDVLPISKNFDCHCSDQPLNLSMSFSAP
jgi:hypothetical protein